MANTSPPALTAHEWARAEEHARSEDDGRATMIGMAWQTKRYGAVIALANAALPDDDLRKITWEKIDDMKANAANSEGEGWPDHGLASFADALASYLPPRA